MSEIRIKTLVATVLAAAVGAPVPAGPPPCDCIDDTDRYIEVLYHVELPDGEPVDPLYVQLPGSPCGDWSQEIDLVQVRAEQSSGLEVGDISWFLETALSAPVDPGGGGPVASLVLAAGSYVTSTFTVGQQTSYDLAFTWFKTSSIDQAGAAYPLELKVERSDAAGDDDYAWFMLPDDPDGSGTETDILHLAPGDYTISVYAAAEWSGSLGPEAIDVELRVFGSLKRITPPPFEVVDFNNESFRDELVPLERRYAADGMPMTGFVADGASRLLLRTPPTCDPAPIVVWIEDENGDSGVGRLIDPFTGVEGEQLTLDKVFDHETGRFRAYVILRAPDTFVRYYGEDQARWMDDPRAVTVRTSYWLYPLPEDTNTQTIDIYRPPIVLVHGLNDGAGMHDWWQGDIDGAWNLQFESDARFFVHDFDYEVFNDVPFVENRLRVGVAIDAVKTRFRETYGYDIAVTQADVVAHSMGGLLARVYALNEFAGLPTYFLRDENFHEGDINRLIMVGTPHLGSPLAPITVTWDNQFTAWGLVLGSIKDWIYDTDSLAGAVADLRPDSAALAFLNASQPPVDVPTHLIAGVGGSPGGVHPYNLRAMLLAWACYPDLIAPFAYATLFSFDQHDALVSRMSALAGTDPGWQDPLWAYSRTEIGGSGGLHGPLIKENPSGALNARLIELLNGDVATNLFEFGNLTVMSPAAPIMPPPCQFTTSSGIVIQLDEPLPVIAGTTATVRLEPIGDYQPDALQLETSWGEIIDFDGLPAEAEIAIPAGELGTARFFALGFDGAGDVGISDPLEFTVDTTAQPIALASRRDDGFLTARHDRLQMRVDAAFDDGVTREVTEVQTVYQSADPLIADVDAGGLVTARGIGTATITATYGGQTAAMTVDVHSILGDFDGDGVIGPDDADRFNACASGPATDDGFVMPSSDCLASFDFDDDGDLDCSDWDALLNAWTAPEPLPCPPDCAPVHPDGSVGDGVVNVNDLLRVIAEYGSTDSTADVTRCAGDRLVDVDDLVAIIAAWPGCQ